MKLALFSCLVLVASVATVAGEDNLEKYKGIHGQQYDAKVAAEATRKAEERADRIELNKGTVVKKSIKTTDPTEVDAKHDDKINEKAGAAYNNGLDSSLLPPLAKGLSSYVPAKAKACCKDECGNKQDCKVGCDMWLAHSSLNWETQKWRNMLQTKCKKQCSQPKEWSNNHKEETHHGLRSNVESYWHVWYLNGKPGLGGNLNANEADYTSQSFINRCEEGCDNFRQNMWKSKCR
eukprot:g4026.t1